jgi:phosphatidylserine/phosphatidylglycerophosphate/cardiolipin synthase-like enzyme
MALSTTRLPPVVPGPVSVKPGARNTVVHPFDPVDSNASIWFPPPAIGKSSVRSPNEVIPYIDGREAYKDVVAAIRTAKRPGHFIYLVGWLLVHDFPLIDGDASTTIEALFTAASKRNVDIRVMLYHQTKLSGEDNTNAINFIGSLPNGKAIHDDRVVRGSLFARILSPYLGVHHQKVLIVNGEEGLVAFQGGMDINGDRLHFGGPFGLHDVHTRIRGLAAGSLWKLFVERWDDHPQSAKFTQIPKQVSDTGNVTDDLQVEVGRTYPNSNAHTLFGGGGPYHFAASGEQTVQALVLNAISKSKKFIYIEDQYLFDMNISNALKAALPNLKKLIILITATGNAADQLQPVRRRKEFISILTGGAQPPTDKVIVCQNAGFPRVPFVHSKTFIFDDKFAIVGSANLNRRGYTHDSEQNVGIFDTNKRKRFFFAHELRMNLWGKLLGKRPIDMVDPIASSVHWSKPIGNIITYVLNQKEPRGPKFLQRVADDLPGPLKDQLWDEGIDPDGT